METLKPYQEYIIRNVLKAVNIPATNKNILNNINVIYEYINKTYATTTKRDYLIILSLVVKELKQPAMADVIYSKAKEYAKEHLRNEYKQTLDESEKRNYIPYGELIQKAEELRTIYNNTPTYKNIVRLLLICLYTLQPPLRNDYNNMKLINSDSEDDRKNNFLLIDNRQNIYIIINKDKVIKLHGRGEIPILNPMLKSIINLYITEYAANNTYLFENEDGTPYTKRKVQYIINGMFEHKTLNFCNLRSAYISEFYKTHHRLLDRQELADKMRHSQKLAEVSYLKFL